MRLSKLQKYILLQCFNRKYSKLDRKELVKFYDSYKKKPGQNTIINSITNSLERLVNKGLIVAFGQITKEKIFLEKIRLTRLGIVVAKKLLGEQKKLPLKMTKVKQPNIT